MDSGEKRYSKDEQAYTQSSVSERIEALFLNNIGLVLTRQQILRVAKDPHTGVEPENWHQRLSELRTDKGYTILSRRDSKALAAQEYLMPHSNRRPKAAKRVLPNQACWNGVLKRAKHACEWIEDGQRCGLKDGDVDPVGGGTVKLTPDHATPHSIDPNADTTDASRWLALCGRHQVMKKNYWDSSTGKINLMGILQSVNERQKREAFEFLLKYFGHDKS